MARWLELTADYRCNNRCVGCPSVDFDGGSMSSREALSALALGRELGARSLWWGGGEPTLRRDLFALTREARRLGYEVVRLQTNGMLLAYPEFARRCRASGVTEVSFSLKGSEAPLHDALTRTPGSHALLHRGIAEARALGFDLQGDLLILRENLADLPAMVRHYHGLGLTRFRVWTLSAHEAREPSLAERVPRLTDVARKVVEAMDLGLSDAAEFLTSLHTPPCTVPRAHRGCTVAARDLGLVVVNPDGRRFRLEESPVEGGHYLSTCVSCVLRPGCSGVRADYVARHGTSEFRPEAVAG